MIPLDRIKVGLQFYSPRARRGEQLPPIWEVLIGPTTRNNGTHLYKAVQIVNLNSKSKEWVSVDWLSESSNVVGTPTLEEPAQKSYTMTADVDPGQ